MLRAALVVAIAGAFVANIVTAQGGGPKLFHISDFHLDPLFATKCAVGPCTHSSDPLSGIAGCDSSRTIVQGAVDAVAREMVETAADPVAVIFSGDAFRHGMTDDVSTCLPGSTPEKLAFTIIDDIMSIFANNLTAAIEKHERRVFQQQQKKLQQQNYNGTNIVINANQRKRRVHIIAAPAIDISVVLGNDDFVPDYAFSNFSQPHPILRKYASSLHANGFLDAAAAAQFGHCAFTAVTLPMFDPTTRVLLLNTLLWSTKIRPPVPDNVTDPCGQFAWFESQLAAARAANERVYIVSHIPPIVSMWRGDFQARYVALMQKYYARGPAPHHSRTLVGQFFGHTHHFTAAALAHGVDVPALFLGGPITRVSSTVPDFTVYSLDSMTAEPTDLYQVSIVDGPSDPLSPHSWRAGNSLAATLGINNLTAPLIYNVARQLRYNKSMEPTWDKYWEFVEGGYIQKDVDKKCKWGDTCHKEFSCMMQAFDLVSAAICML